MAQLNDLGIDLGTSNVLIYQQGKGLVLRRPAVVAIERSTKKVLAIGDDAQRMVGRTPSNIMAIRPLKQGTVADFELTNTMLRFFLNGVLSKRLFAGPRVVMSVPSGVTETEKHSLINILLDAGVKRTYLLDRPLAAALGVGMDLRQRYGRMIVDMGAGITDIAVISMGGLARSVSLKTGGAAFDDAIVKFVRNEHNVNIGVVTAERLKKQIGCVKRRPVEVGMTVSGINLFSGLPQSVEITSGDLLRVMNETADDIIRSVQDVFEHTAPEMLADTAEDGIVLTGGGALTYGMAEMLSIRLSTKINMAEDPENSVVNGLGKALEDFSMLKNHDYHFRSLEDLMVE